MTLLQATSGVHEAGIGFRRSKDLALPAFIASRLESRWIVEKLMGDDSMHYFLHGDVKS